MVVRRPSFGPGLVRSTVPDNAHQVHQRLRRKLSSKNLICYYRKTISTAWPDLATYFRPVQLNTHLVNGPNFLIFLGARQPAGARGSTSSGTLSFHTIRSTKSNLSGLFIRLLPQNIATSPCLTISRWCRDITDVGSI